MSLSDLEFTRKNHSGFSFTGMIEQDAQSRGQEALAPALGAHQFMLASADQFSIAIPIPGWFNMHYLQSFSMMRLS